MMLNGRRDFATKRGGPSWAPYRNYTYFESQGMASLELLVMCLKDFRAITKQLAFDTLRQLF